MKELVRRYLVFTVAIFVSALGVSIITRSCLGTSPISSLPYVFSLNTTLSMGSYIFILNMILICLQMLMLGTKGIKQKRMELFLQIPISVLFGACIDLCMWLTGLHIFDAYAARLVVLVVGCFTLALGVSLEVVADVAMVSAEYALQIASKKFNKPFGNLKLIFDVTLVTLGVISSYLFSADIQGIREGTVVAALITGPFVKFIIPRLNFIRVWQQVKASDAIADSDVVNNSATIITISREYGSGGREVGELLAKRLGIPFYDNELIELVAKESNFSEEFVREKEQNMPHPLLYQMVMQDYGAPLEKSLSADDALFVAQSRVIRSIAAKGDCVIVGRCADYILSDFPNVINVFLHADTPFRVKRVVDCYGVLPECADDELRRADRARSEHYYHYTNREWGNSRNYHLTCNMSLINVDRICSIIESMFKFN